MPRALIFFLETNMHSLHRLYVISINDISAGAVSALRLKKYNLESENTEPNRERRCATVPDETSASSYDVNPHQRKGVTTSVLTWLKKVWHT